uniref:Purple acid phosphatase n=1 Tax=Araucaria cunninghamii TaxID=56994 RepID=A0A0D6R693_ARACU
MAMEFYSATMTSMLLLLLLQFPPNAYGDTPLSLLVVGDWGRKGLFNQSQVAAQMGTVAEKLGIDFVISTGDNFYEDGLTGTDDPSFTQSFSDIYSTSSLQKPWHVVLGNHDYRGDTLSQLDPALKSRDSRWNCYRTSILKQNLPASCTGQCPSVHFFFIDTTPFVDQYWAASSTHKYDWRGVLPRDRYLIKQLQDLNNTLKVSQATWKIVVGHHPIRSVGTHDDTVELKQQLLPVLEANQVDLYVNGHAHCLQDFKSETSSLRFLTSGGGSKAWGRTNFSNTEGLEFFYPGQGFMTMQITPTYINGVFYDINENSLHSFNSTKS